MIMGAAILFAFALSFDGFGVGLSYGMRRIRIPLLSMFIITLCTIFSMGSAIVFGNSLMNVLTFLPTKILGACILLSLGGFQIVKTLFHGIKGEACREAISSCSSAMHEPVIKLEFKFLGVIIQVLKAPEQADMDGSGIISPKESVLLGCALSLDALASGLGLGLSVGLLNSLPAIGLVAGMQFLMIRLGQALTGRIPEDYVEKLGFLPGTVLILIALGKLI
jgi:putative sporulation protein YtaF